MNRLSLRISALLVCLAGAVSVPAAAPWRFVITCDSRGGLATGVNDPILAEMVRETLSWNAEFLVFAGDLVYGAGIPADEFETQLWNWVRGVRPLYDAGIGVYVCRGNHEVGDMWRAGPNEPPDLKDNYALRWLHVFGSDQHPELKLPDNGPPGETYMTYAVAHKNVLVLALDQYAGTGHRVVHSVNQPWVETQLRANTKPHVFAFGHEPAFRTWHPDCLDADPDRRDALWRSLASAGARVYTCGHDHYYDHARVEDGDGNPNNDIHQLIVATAGAPSYSWTPPYDGDNGDFNPLQLYHVEQRWGYVVVEIDDRNVTTTWMERQNNVPSQPGVYKAKHVWTYTAAAGPAKLTADLNGDGRVDFADLAILASQWLATGNPPSVLSNSRK
ncbi:MAG: metallophosphoesterase [Planctomycetes bacterium]|nr:metallophosphoesterase [Planctomycetota bacterium]